MSLRVACALNRPAFKVITRNNNNGQGGCVIWVAYRTDCRTVNGGQSLSRNLNHSARSSIIGNVNVKLRRSVKVTSKSFIFLFNDQVISWSIF